MGVDYHDEHTSRGFPLKDGVFVGNGRMHLLDRKGGDIDEWPHDLRVRQFPEVRT